jgi:NodT family efflux transporter outer membrane factor (OMF) lipoprotein
MTSSPTPVMSPSCARISRAAVFCTLLLGGCDVGPRYVAPDDPAPSAFKEGSDQVPGVLSTGSWQPADPQDAVLKGTWWEMFHEPELNALVDRLNIDNQNIAQYFQNFMAARAQVREANAGYFPTLSATPAASRSGAGSTAISSTSPSGGATGGPTGNGFAISNSFSLPFEASWEPDLWGRIANTVHEYQYAAQASAADLENERLMEQAALVEFFFELRGQDALQLLADHLVEADRASLELTRALVDTGIDGPEAIAEVELVLDSAAAAAIGIAANRAIYEHAIATLIGRPASSFSLPVRILSTPVPAIPVGVPSQLLQRRPDIAAAERTLAQANAVIGIATAAYYPTVDLTASGGLQSSAITRLFSLPALVWSLGASASQTIFDGGLRSATVDQYTAAYKADVAAYRQTVLTAFQQVEDALAALRVLSQQIVKQEAAVGAALRYVDIAMARYQTGLGSNLDVITAQVALLGAQQSLATLRIGEMTVAVQLVQALGGGWDVRRLPSAAQAPPHDTAQEPIAAP